MKRLLTGTALAAVIFDSALAQVQADRDFDVQKQIEKIDQQVSDTPDLLILSHPKPFDSDEIIVAGTRLGVLSKDDLTVPASVLTETEIAARGQQTVAELLRTLPGIAVNRSGTQGGLTDIRMRGAEANQVLVLIDGVEVADPSNGGYDFAGLRAADIVKIEVLRGEQSALYGSDAVAGVISIVTRAGETTPRWRARLEAGSRNTAEGQLSAVIPVGQAALSINGNAFTTEGFDVSGSGGERDGSKSRSLNVGLNALQLGAFRLDGKYESSILTSDFDSGNFLAGGLSDAPQNVTDRKREAARLDLRFATGSVDHKVSGSWSETDTDTPIFGSRTIGERTNLNWVAGLQSGAHNVTLLGEYEKETFEQVGDPDIPDNEMGAVAADYRLDIDALTLSVSARYDLNDLFEDAITWRLGVGYGFDWEGRIRASVGTGIKNPSLIDLFGFFPESSFIGNPDLEPEESLGVSVGYEQTVGNFRASVDYFYSELRNEITGFTFNGFSSLSNLATDSTREGLELEASYILDGFRLSGSATLLDSEQNGVEEIRRPDFLSSATLDWDATDRLALALFVDHTGSQLDTNFATFSVVELDSFTLVGANASYDLSDSVALTLRGENLLDEDYQELFGYASAGRAVYAGLALDF
ncbi:MAG: TonB-dependent receptor [Pseudomonadota bacterium]